MIQPIPQLLRRLWHHISARRRGQQPHRPEAGLYDALVIAVAHDEFKLMGMAGLRNLANGRTAIHAPCPRWSGALAANAFNTVLAFIRPFSN